MDTYEKKYKEAQKWIESIYPNLSHEQQMEAEAFFPELKESEDEKIRKWIIGVLSTYEHDRDLRNAAIAWLEKQAEQKSAWSEEDEKMVANLVDYFKVDDALQYTEKQVVDWLKSLKDRAQPQPKQEWSEEDQNALEDVREAVVHYWGGETQDILLYWLKSIKQRIKKEAV